MTGFTNDLTKNDIPIGSGLTKIFTSDGQPILLGMHEAAYLKNNAGSLISTNQAREAGTWVDDVLKCHSGTPRIVVQVEGSTSGEQEGKNWGPHIGVHWLTHEKDHVIG